MGMFDDLIPSKSTGTAISAPSTRSGGMFNDLIPSTNQQKAGPVPSKEGIKSLLPRKDEIPELLGSMAGVAAKTTPAGVALSGIGAGIGELVRQGMTGEKLEPMQRLEKFGEAGMRGMGSAYVGKVVDWARGLFGKRIPEAAYNAFLQTSKAQAVSDIAKGAETLGSKIAETPGMYGTRQSVLNRSKVGINALEDKIQTEINKATAMNPKLSLDTFEVAGALDDLIGKYESTGVNQREVRQLFKIQSDFLDKQGQEIPIRKANDLKRVFHEIIDDRAYLKGLEQNPVKIQAERALASELRKKIADKITTLNELNAKQGLLIGARDSLIQALANETRSIPQAVAGEVLEPAFTRTARVSRVLGKASEKLPLETGAVAGTSVLTQRITKEKKK